MRLPYFMRRWKGRTMFAYVAGYSHGYLVATRHFYRSVLYLSRKLKAGEDPSFDEVRAAGKEKAS